MHFFRENPVNEFTRLKTLIKPGRRLVMVFQSRWTKSEEEVKEVAEITKKQYEEADLTNIEVYLKKMSPATCICISGIK